MDRKQTAATSWRRLTRRVGGLPVVVWALGIAGTGIALAAILTSLGISGSFSYTPAPSASVEYTSATYDPGVSTGSCNWTFTPNTVSVTAWPDFGPNEVCAANVGVRLISSNAGQVFLSDFVEDDAVLTLTTRPIDCHVFITGSPTTFQLRVTSSNFDGTQSATAVLDAGDGIEFSDAPGEGDCDSSTP